MAHRIIETLDEHGVEAKEILEVGCGTGYLTQLLVERFPHACVTAIDFAKGMIKLAQGRVDSHVRFQMEDIEIHSVDWERYDLIAGNAVIHWFHHAESTLRQLVNGLKPGGFMVCSAFGPDTLKELDWVYQHITQAVGIAHGQKVKTLRTMEEWEKIYRNVGICNLASLQCWHRIGYSCVRELLDSIRAMGVVAIRGDDQPISLFQSSHIMEEIIHRYKRAFRNVDGGVYATYQLIQLYGWKRDERLFLLK